MDNERAQPFNHVQKRRSYIRAIKPFKTLSHCFIARMTPRSTQKEKDTKNRNSVRITRTRYSRYTGNTSHAAITDCQSLQKLKARASLNRRFVLPVFVNRNSQFHKPHQLLYQIQPFNFVLFADGDF